MAADSDPRRFDPVQCCRNLMVQFVSSVDCRPVFMLTVRLAKMCSVRRLFNGRMLNPGCCLEIYFDVNPV
nr:hypothetical protein Itr_chr14CG10380 [Ipomoea trifida]